MGEPDGGRAGAVRWKAAHDALHEDSMALVGIVSDKERVAARLRVLESRADRLATREEKVRLVEAEREALEREAAAVMRLLEEVKAAREVATADYRAGREDAEARAAEAAREMGLCEDGDARDAVARRLEAEDAEGAAAFDEKHTTVFLRLHDQARSWLGRYDPSGALRRTAGRGPA